MFLSAQRVLNTAIQSRFLDTKARKVGEVGLALISLHVASAFIALALHDRRSIYGRNFPGEYNPTTPLQYIFKDLRAYLMLTRVINKISSLFRTHQELNIRAVSWNLSSAKDRVDAPINKRVIENKSVDSEEARYKKASIAHMKQIIHRFGPDIILLQELAGQINEKGRYEHTPLLGLLRTNGYRIYAPADGTAVVFKEKIFNFEKIPDSFRKGSACIELIHKATGQKVRAVSDHLKDFNSKKCRHEKKRHGEFIWETQTGDAQLNEIVKRHLKKGGDDNKFLVIYGLNSNTTPPDMHFKDRKVIVHPERLKPLVDAAFIRDKDLTSHEEHATTLDPFISRPLKFDHIFCWHPQKAIKVARQIIDNINDPELLDRATLFTTTGSFHLPVAAIIQLSD